MEPLDLRTHPPRSCYTELDGLIFLPRTIDKIRALLPGGNAGPYFVAEAPITTMSGYLLQRLGVSEAELTEAVRSANDDEDVARWLRERTDASQYPAINTALRHIKPKHASDEGYFRSLYAETLAAHPELEFILDIIEADDKRMYA